MKVLVKQLRFMRRRSAAFQVINDDHVILNLRTFSEWVQIVCADIWKKVQLVRVPWRFMWAGYRC